MPNDASTPLMRQYTAIKKEHPNSLLFFRLGDFYELFFDDAVTAARELQITLTSRNKEKGIAVPMCGVPYHAADGYITKLIRRGFKVAVCDQMEDAKHAIKLVRREVTRVLTPGTAADNSLGSEENNFLAALARLDSDAKPVAGFAALDLSTGEFRATEFQGDDAERRVLEELEQLRPREVLYASSAPLFDSPVSMRQAAASGRRVSLGRDSARGLGRLLLITLCPSWRTSSASFRWRVLDWRATQRQLVRRARFFIMSAPLSEARSITLTASAFTSGRIAWCWTPSVCATWN